jgi:hypothetical protein
MQLMKKKNIGLHQLLWKKAPKYVVKHYYSEWPDVIMNKGVKLNQSEG